MAYQLITNRNSKNFTPFAQVPAVYGRKRTIESITIHWWGLPEWGDTFDGVCSFLCTNNKPTSAHEVIEAGRVAVLVNHLDASWAAGNGVGNATSLHLECRPRASAEDYATVAERIRDLRAEYGNLPLIPHNHWQATQCPGHWDLAKLDRLARSIGSGSATAPTPAPAPAPAEELPLVWKVERGDTLGKIAGHYGVTVERLAAHNGIKDPNRVEVGAVLAIPGPLVWHVDPGDTLAKIAAYYGTDVGRIQRLNGITDPNRISVGQTLLIQR